MPFEIIQLTSFKVNNNKRALALGMFDGLHKGHSFLIRELINKAKEKNLIPCATTFKESPLKWTNPSLETQLITSLDERLLLFKELGLSEIIIFDFPALNELEPEVYFKDILLKRLNCAYLTCGLNHTFGKEKKGNIDLLKTYLAELNGQFEFEVCEPIYTENQNIISSSQIRQLLKIGKIKEANQLLGHHFLVYGAVRAGNQIGRKLGFPTLNLAYNPEKVKIPNGVYAGYTQIQHKNYLSAVNIGLAPTINNNLNSAPIIESHLLEPLPEELNLKIGENLKIELLEFMRPEHKFDSIDNLKKQISLDCQNIRKLKNTYINSI